MDTSTLQQAIGLLLCGLILMRTEPALNRMGHEAPALVRLSFALLAAASLAGILAIFSGRIPGFETLLLATGTATLLLCDRRIRILTRHKGPRHA